MRPQRFFAKAATVSLLTMTLIACSGSDDEKSLTEEQKQDTPEEIAPVSKTFSLFFESGEDQIRGDQEPFLNALAKTLKESGETFEIRGCTDESGPADKNYWLAHRRAWNIAEYFKEQGIAINPNGLSGQNRDIHGTNEGECPDMASSDSEYEITNPDQNLEMRVDIITNPDYPSPNSINKTDDSIFIFPF